MKYILVLLDGMADYPISSLGGKTPLEFAHTPTMDKLAKTSEIGLVQTVPEGYKPGSDVANLGVLGYDVKKCYTGRSPLEALSMGINLADDDLAMRANLVTLSDGCTFENKTMVDYGAGEISTAEAKILIDGFNAFAADKCLMDGIKLYAGISYRHCLVIKNTPPRETLIPPHDITGQQIGDYLPVGECAKKLIEIIKSSHAYLSGHPVNLERIKQGKNPANALWFWGEGTKPIVENFAVKYGKRGAIVSAVDLLKGIAIAGGMKAVQVDGATGTLLTNFDGKARAAIAELEGGTDFCMVHLEAPDECGHQGDLNGKIKAIELIDEKIISPIFEHFAANGEEFAMLIMPDHYTPLSKRTHSSEPVPYMLYRSSKVLQENGFYSEASAKASGVFIQNPEVLTKKFLSL